MARKLITVMVTLSVDEQVSRNDALRELRTRVNEGGCTAWHWTAVRVRRIDIVRTKAGGREDYGWRDSR